MAERILIVEDDPVNMKVMMMALRKFGYDFLQAADGEEALEVALKEKPDVILMDIQLPKMNGLEVTRILRGNSTLANVPIIAVTAHAMGGYKERAAEAGCDAYVTKPVDTRRLPEVVAEALRRRRDET